MFVSRFTSLHLEPYDMRCFLAMVYFQLGCQDSRLMSLGGWNTLSVMKQHYVEESLVLTAQQVQFYAWFKQIDPVVLGSDVLYAGGTKQATDIQLVPSKAKK